MLFKKLGKKTSFKIIISFLILISLLIGLYFGYQYYAFDYRYRNEVEAISETTNTESMYEDKDVMKVISKYDTIHLSAGDDLLESSYVLPGLQQTRTLDSQGNISMCTSMTPQGICVSKDYIFVSAYCHTHQHNSVIYMMNRKTHEYIKEIVLDGQYHLGNICYDSINDNIWAACTGKNKATGRKCAYLNALSLDSIKSYALEDEIRPLHFIKKYALADFRNASFISYYSGNIFVGVYYEGLWDESYVQRFPIDEQGGLDGTIINGINGKGRVVYGKEKAKISECCQGFYYTGDVLLLMQSSGPTDSTIRYFYESKFEQDINRLLEMEKEYQQYLQKKRVADNFEMQRDVIQEHLEDMRQQLVDLKEEFSKENHKKEDTETKEKEENETDETEEKSLDEQIRDLEKEIAMQEEKYNQLGVYYDLAMDSVPEFDVKQYQKMSNSTKTYSILNEKANVELTLPPRLEQAMVTEIDDYSKMYLLFESAAYSYRAQSRNIIDRVLVLDF